MCVKSRSSQQKLLHVMTWECSIVGFCLFVPPVFILLEYCCSVSREHTEKLGGNNNHMELLSCYLSQVMY